MGTKSIINKSCKSYKSVSEMIVDGMSADEAKDVLEGLNSLSVSSEIKFHRIMKKMSQEELGKMCGFSRQQIQRLENQRNEQINLGQLDKVFKALGLFSPITNIVTICRTGMADKCHKIEELMAFFMSIAPEMNKVATKVLESEPEVKKALANLTLNTAGELHQQSIKSLRDDVDPVKELEEG